MINVLNTSIKIQSVSMYDRVVKYFIRLFHIIWVYCTLYVLDIALDKVYSMLVIENQMMPVQLISKLWACRIAFKYSVQKVIYKNFFGCCNIYRVPIMGNYNRTPINYGNEGIVLYYHPNSFYSQKVDSKY